SLPSAATTSGGAPSWPRRSSMEHPSGQLFVESRRLSQSPGEWQAATGTEFAGALEPAAQSAIIAGTRLRTPIRRGTVARVGTCWGGNKGGRAATAAVEALSCPTCGAAMAAWADRDEAAGTPAPATPRTTEAFPVNLSLDESSVRLPVVVPLEEVLEAEVL